MENDGVLVGEGSIRVVFPAADTKYTIRVQKGVIG